MTQDRLVLDEKNVALLCALLDGQAGERRRTNGQLEKPWLVSSRLLCNLFGADPTHRAKSANEIDVNNLHSVKLKVAE